MTTTTSAQAVTDTESLEQYRERARRWLNTVTIPDDPAEAEESFCTLRNWQRVLHEAGWLGISWSREAGGQGLSPAHQMIFAEESARAGAPQPIGVVGLEVVGPSIDKFGTDDQRRTLLPRLLSGEEIWCQGFSEPEAGSDLASLRTRANVDGDDFIINGQKIWTSWAHKSAWCALLVRTEPNGPKHQGISYVLVDMTSPGITARPIQQMTGETEFCEVFFEDVRVPRSNLLGELNSGWALANDTLSHERGGATLRSAMEAEVVLNEIVRELRHHYMESGLEVPVSIQERLGRATMAVRALEAQSRFTAKRMFKGEIPSPYDSVDKMTVSRTEQLLYGIVRDLLGPFHVATESSPLGLTTRRWVRAHLYARVSSIYGGSEQIQKNIISKRLLELPHE